jgi:endonuclease/exonuclease/phosphatase family metal-dependent hydrolase
MRLLRLLNVLCLKEIFATQPNSKQHRCQFAACGLEKEQVLYGDELIDSLRRRRMMRNKYAFAIVLSMFALSLCGSTAFAQGASKVTIVAWNLHAANPAGSVQNNCNRRATEYEVRQFKQVIDLYNASHARNIDVITLTEVKRWQVIYLRNSLNDSQNTYRSYFLKTKTCSCGEPDEDFGNAIISRLPIASPRSFTLPPDGPQNPSACNKFEYTKLGAYSVQAPSGQWLRIYNAHLGGINLYSRPNGYNHAIEQVRETLRAMLTGSDAIALGQPRAILVGDFNTYPSSGACARHGFGTGPYRHLTEYREIPNARLIDAWVERADPDPFDPDPDKACGYTASTTDPSVRFDYVFRRRNSGLRTDRIEVVKPSFISAGTIPNTISDHFPVVAELSF